MFSTLTSPPLLNVKFDISISDFCPDWYLAAWEQGRNSSFQGFFLIFNSPTGNYPIPDSMKGEYDVSQSCEEKPGGDVESEE